MATAESIDQLNHLIQVNENAQAGLRTAAENIRNSELETLFLGYATQHGKFAAELLVQIGRVGGDSSRSGTLGGALQRGWMDLKSALSGHSAAAILSSCEAVEESAEVAYADAADANTSGQVHALIHKHLEQIKGFRTRLARLVGQTKDGVDFQRNE